MPISQSEEIFQDDNISITQRDIEIEGDEGDFVFEGLLDEADTTLVIQVLSGEAEITEIEVPLENEVRSEYQGHIFSGVIDRGQRVIFRINAAIRSKIRVFFVQTKKAMRKALNAFPCRFCKLAVGFLLQVVVIHLGVPALTTGGFDFGAVNTTFQGLAGDILKGNLGSVPQKLLSIMPTTLWQTLSAGFQALGWLFDLTDKLHNWVCQKLGFCPPHPPPQAGP